MAKKKIKKQKSPQNNQITDSAPKQEKGKEMAEIKTDVQKELQSIYGTEGEVPDMSKLERIKKSKWSKILIITFSFLLVISIATWVGFLIFGGLNSFTGENISLEIEAPADIASGEEITYTIHYANKEKIPVSRVEAVVNYPKGFIFKEAVPAPTTEGKNTWSLGTLAKGEKGEIKITGQILGNLETQETMSAVLNYRPANFNSDFQEATSLTSQITSSVIGLELEHDDQVVAGEETPLTIKITNNKKDNLSKVKITLNFPDSFIVDEESFDPEPDPETGSWIIENLKSSEDSKIKLNGSFAEDSADKEQIAVTVELETADEEWALQQETAFDVEILKGDLLVSLIANGDTEGKPINFGDTINYSLVYQNKGDTEVQDLSITAKYEGGDLIDWDNLSDDNEGEVKDNTITWTGDEIRDLRSVKPDEEGTIDWQIKLKNKSDFGKDEAIPGELLASVEITIGEVGESGSGSTVTTTTLTHELNSDLTLNAKGRYYNDDNIALGTGPLPPEVGKTTSFRIFWELQNSVHEVNNVKVKTILPDNVYWTGKSVVSAGQLNFNVNTREIIWTINRIPLTVRKLEANFEVSVTPSESDANTVLTLIPETALEATDKTTDDKISLVSGAITSNLDGDPIAEGKGLVE